MKFLRLNEYRTVRTAEVIEALSVYDAIHEMCSEIRTASTNSRILTASTSLLRIKVAKIVESAEGEARSSLLLSNAAEELEHIKAKTPDLNEQKKVISNWLFGPNGHWKFLWESLYKNYLPRLTKALVRGFGNTPPVDEETAQDIATRALGEFMEQKDSASVVSSLAKFDASQGALMTWLEGGIRATTQRMVAQHFALKNSETSMNQKIGDNDDTEMGEMIQDGKAENPFDIVDYSEKADRLITTLAHYIRTLTEQIERSNNPGEKFKLQNLLQHISNPANDVSQKIAQLKKLATNIDYITDELADVKLRKQEFIKSLSGKNPDANTVNMAKTYLAKFENKTNTLQEKESSHIEEFNQIYADLRNMAQYDEETGATRIEPQMPNQATAPGAEAVPGGMTPGEMTPGIESPIAPSAPEVSSDPILRTKARGNRVLLSPGDQKIMEDKMQASRDKLRPAMFKAMSFPQGKKDLSARSSNLFGLKEVEKHIDNTNDLDALIQGDLSKASYKAFYADIVVRGMLYVRDQAAMDKAYDPEVVVSGSEEIRNALNKFYNFVKGEVGGNNATLEEKEAEYQQLPPEEQAQFEASPKAFVLQELSKLIVGSNKNQVAGTEANRFRTLYEYFDHMARASAYESNREEKFKDKDWDDLNDEDRSQISQQVYEDQYGAGHRSMYTGRYRENSELKKKFEPRYPMAPDTEGTRYKNIMNQELWRIGRQRALSKLSKQSKDAVPDARYPDERYHQYRNPAWGVDNWYEISNNPEDFKNKSRPKNTGGETLANSGVIDILIKIASDLDKMGSYRAADQLTNDIKRLIHG